MASQGHVGQQFAQYARATSTPEEGPDFDIDTYNSPIRPASGFQDTWARQPWRGDYG